MKLLLDTCAMIWMMENNPRLSITARQAIEDMDNEVSISMVSLQEIAIKTALGKLSLRGIAISDIPGVFEKQGVTMVEITAVDCERYTTLPVLDHHRDPFDRLLACQALNRKLTLVSADSKLKEYRDEGLETLW